MGQRRGDSLQWYTHVFENPIKVTSVFHIHCQTAGRQCWSEGISSMRWISMTPLRRNNSLSFPLSENIKVYLSISDIKIQCLNDSFECALSSAYSMPLLKLPQHPLPWTPRGYYTGNSYSLRGRCLLHIIPTLNLATKHSRAVSSGQLWPLNLWST